VNFNQAKGEIMFKKERTFETIVAPLSKIETDLAFYIGEQSNKRANLEDEKQEIEKEIVTSRLEKKKSEHTVVKIAELLGSNFTESDLDDETIITTEADDPIDLDTPAED